MDGVTYGNGKFVAVGEGGGICTTSIDGLTWTKPVVIEKESGLLRKVVYISGTFVAIGFHGTVLKSTDAINWSKETVKDNNGQNISLNSICEIP